MDGRAMGAQEMVIAIFRLAVADYLGIAYGHDHPDRRQRARARNDADAASFLTSAWAAYLGDLAGVPAPLIWSEATRLKRAIDASARQPSA